MATSAAQNEHHLESSNNNDEEEKHIFNAKRLLNNELYFERETVLHPWSFLAFIVKTKTEFWGRM